MGQGSGQPATVSLGRASHEHRPALHNISRNHGKLANDGKKTYRGTPVVAIRDTSDDSKLYVAATGKPYPVAITGGKKGQSGTITFGDWNANVSLSAPKGAIGISELGG